MYNLEIAVAKVPHAGAVESGETVEVIERPAGGFSVVLVNGQGSGRGAKSLSNSLVTRAIAQLKDGARDGVVARAVHDYLYTYRAGQVAASLNIASVDFRSGTIRVTRNNPAPFYIIDPAGIHRHDEPSRPIGLHAATRPQISELEIRPDLYVVIFTEGLREAGARFGNDVALENVLAGCCDLGLDSARDLADRLLQRALDAEQGAPEHDLSVVVLTVRSRQDDGAVQRLMVQVPFEPRSVIERRSTL
jgi:serine phosphatase RsbU (regulator of sigma subunit)